MADRLFRDRRDAGCVLAGFLEHYRDRDDVIVLGLPRGGVPVAYEVATALGAPLEVFLVRKLGLPRQPELAMGALASGGVVVINKEIVRGLGVPPEVIDRVVQEEGRELLRREQQYRGGRPMREVTGQIALVVDDGVATGASMRAALRALRRLRPARLVVAVPVAPKSTCTELAGEVDEMVCAVTPSPFVAVGAAYQEFAQTTDDEVRDVVTRIEQTRSGKPAQPTAPASPQWDVDTLPETCSPAV